VRIEGREAGLDFCLVNFHHRKRVSTDRSKGKICSNFANRFWFFFRIVLSNEKGKISSTALLRIVFPIVLFALI
jgi:hypothetical protein